MRTFLGCEVEPVEVLALYWSNAVIRGVTAFVVEVSACLSDWVLLCVVHAKTKNGGTTHRQGEHHASSNTTRPLPKLHTLIIGFSCGYAFVL